jgi:hypothetical protein
MKRIVKTWAVAIAAFALSTSGAQAATEAQWRRDIDVIVENISALHPRPWTEIGRLSFLRQAEALKSELPRLSEEQRVVRAMRLVALIGDRATALEPDNPTFNEWYPIRLYQFTDGYFVTAAHRSVADLAGAQIVAIGGRPVAEAMEIARGLLSANGIAERTERLYAIHNSGLMRGAGLADADGRLRIRARLASGRMVDRALTPARTDSQLYASGGSPFIWADLSEPYGTPLGTHDDWFTAYRNLPAMAFRTPDDARPLHLRHRRVFFAQALPAQEAYYAQINYMSNSAQETFEDFFQRMMREVDAARPRRLIIDLRFNAGGDGSKAIMMAQEIVRRGPDTPWRELYILVGRRTGGAAISGLDAFVRNTPATIIGEPTGGQYNSISDSRSFAYPDTHIRVSVAVTTGQMSESNDLSDTILPDIPAPFSFADWRAGRDPAIDPILSGIEMRSVPVLARMEGGAAARRIDGERRTAFRRHAWWRPLRFNAVKTVGYDLLRADRAADSVEMFTLMTELYPDEWNSWESLGRGQTAAGTAADARTSYRCALALDPENFDAGDLRAALAEAPNEPPTMPAACPVGSPRG